MKVLAVLLLLGMAALAECVVYSAACKAGVDWKCYAAPDR
jgi:hypothetical protein